MDYDKPVLPRRQAGAVPMWVLIGLGLLGGLGLYWYTTPREAPSWARGWLPGSPDPNKPLYRWQDRYGREHITDKPPTGRPYDVVIHPYNTNVVPSSGRASNP